MSPSHTPLPKHSHWWPGLVQGLGSAWAPYFDKLLEVRGLVCLLLDQGSPIQLAAAEADVGLHMWQLGRQDVTDHLHRHLLSRHLLANSQCSARKHDTAVTRRTSRSHRSRMCVRGANPRATKGSMWVTRNRKRSESSATERLHRSIFLGHDGCLLALRKKNFRKNLYKTGQH